MCRVQLKLVISTFAIDDVAARLPKELLVSDVILCKPIRCPGANNTEVEVQSCNFLLREPLIALRTP